VAIVQRFGGALNLNVHLHALVLDGVFVLDKGVPPRCLSMGRADAADVRIRRPGLSALWRAAAPHRAD
jgi:hypothetical protein